MINLQIPPKIPKELYKFFMEIARPPVKSHVAYVSGSNYIREDWVVNTYQARSNTYGLWFRYKESNSPEWYKVYREYDEDERA